MPLVSVVITTKNEESNIRTCLASVQAQSFKDFELIVVDNNSTDRTKEISHEFTEHVFNLGPERSAQRNYGISRGNGTYVLYLDADMILSPEVIRECVEAMQKDSGLVGLYIPETIIGSGFWIKVRRFERGFYNGTAIDAVRFLRRQTFDEIAGFDVSLTGVEDWDLDIRMRERGRTAIIGADLCHNEGEFNFWRYVRKKSYYAKSFAAYVRKWGPSHPAIRQQLGVGYRYVGVYVEQRKFWRLLAHPLLTASMYLLRFLVGVVYLTRAE